jgi:hypothetical protein
MQTTGIPGFPSKTPVAQMPFASELPLSLLEAMEGKPDIFIRSPR